MQARSGAGLLQLVLLVQIACSSGNEPSVNAAGGSAGGSRTSNSNGGTTNVGTMSLGGQSSLSGAAGTATCDHTLGNAACWALRDLGSIAGISGDFFGAVFDGRHVYYVSSSIAYPPIHLRHDTQSEFAAPASWTFVDTSASSPGPYFGGVFDGKFVYLTSGQAGTTIQGVNLPAYVSRFDSSLEFTSSAAWVHFNLTNVSGSSDSNTPAYQGAAFDGRYVYFAPKTVGSRNTAPKPSGKVARYDTQGEFLLNASWSTFDLGAVDANATGFSGAVFDGQYVYLVPQVTASPRVARYDTRKEFAAPGSWSSFATTSLTPFAYDFHGGVFDGRYIYFVAAHALALLDGTMSSTDMVRYDTQGVFEDSASWSVYILGGTAAETAIFHGGVFDGRYVYYVPYATGPLVRYDTTGDFRSASAWEVQSLSSWNPNPYGYRGAAFDGRFVYLVPTQHTATLRFDARTTSELPSAYHGSFY